MTFAYFAELPRRRDKVIFGPVEAKTADRAFDQLWIRHPRAISIALYPLKLIHGYGRTIPSEVAR